MEVSAAIQETSLNNGEAKPKQVFKEVTSDSNIKHLQCGGNNAAACKHVFFPSVVSLSDNTISSGE